MNDNIDWTEQAGEAVVAQTDDVLASIQRLREKAIENGYLIDNEAQTVEEVNDKIVISPATPDVVYVPTYDSKVVYTTPVTGPPVYHYSYDYGPGYVYHDDDDWEDALIAGGIILGGAIILDEIFDDDDWDGWDSNDDIDWDGGDITIDRGDMKSTSTAATSALETASGPTSAMETDRRSATAAASASAKVNARRSSAATSPAPAKARATARRSPIPPAATSPAKRSRRASPPERRLPT